MLCNNKFLGEYTGYESFCLVLWMQCTLKAGFLPYKYVSVSIVVYLLWFLRPINGCPWLLNYSKVLHISYLDRDYILLGICWLLFIGLYNVLCCLEVGTWGEPCHFWNEGELKLLCGDTWFARIKSRPLMKTSCFPHWFIPQLRYCPVFVAGEVRSAH